MPLIRREKAIVKQTEGSSSRSWSEEDSYPNEADEFSPTDEDEWRDEEDYDDLLPSDSASTTHEHLPPRARGPRVASRGRQVSYPSQQQFRPAPPSTVDPADDYGQHGHGGHYQQPAHSGYYGGGGRQHGQTYHPQQAHGGHYMGGYGGANQMIPFGTYGNANPFSPMANGSNGASYFQGDAQRGGMYDVMPYQQPGAPAYYGNAHPNNLPAYLQQFHLSNVQPPEPPAQTKTPAPPETDPERLRLEAELKAFKAHEEKVAAAEKQRELEAQIRKDAEESFQRRMEDMRKAQEDAKKEIEKAKAEAERAARERIEAERKAEEERQKAHAEAMARAEENARKKFEAEMKAAEEKRKREDEARARAEEAAKIRLELAIKAEAEARAAAAKKAAEELERLKLIQEDAKRKAEAEAAAKVEAEKKAAADKAEAEANAKVAAEELKKKIESEAKAKFEEEAKKVTEKPPIKFKDAVGRKFSFPFHLCQTWQGMEELIKQAFLQVDVLGPHVQEGHYDLIGPNGEIILPSVWEKVIQPDWAITMTMWPMDKAPPIRPRHPPGMHGARVPPPPGARPGNPLPGRRPNPIIPPPPGIYGGRPRPGMPAGVDVVTVNPKEKKKDAKRNSTMLGFFAGKPSSKKKSSKK